MGKRILALILAGLLMCGVAFCENDWSEEWASSVVVDVDWDNIYLFEGYIEQTLNEHLNNVHTPHITLGESLSGADLALYEILRDTISRVASTGHFVKSITLPYEVLGLTKSTYTAQELGVSSVKSWVHSHKHISDAINPMLGLETEKVGFALEYDMPYDLYWTTFIRFEHDIQFSSKELYLKQFKIEFGNKFAEHTLSEKTCETIIDEVHNAMENADAIVKAHAKESDYDKLRSYEETICDMVSYNYELAGVQRFHGTREEYEVESAFGQEYFWVFDGDADTNVVCNGYAKAFKYLCDISNFDGEVLCSTVSGGLEGINHAWNVVKMPDGNNYLVDVTNCDDGLIGEGDRLFLRGSTNGDVFTGYTIPVNSRAMRYRYDEILLSLVDLDMLALATQDYTPDSAVR
ncbi:MAG: hypothetical protein IJ074_00750 [Clostridia bacterium]|nr:hypothetical protein [Clostridia bacterium]